MSRSKCCQTMLISQRMMFMLLLTRLQWTRCEPTTTSAKIIESSMSVATSSSTTVTNSASSRVTEYDTESSSITLLETQSNEATQQLYSSTEETTQSFTSNNKISFNSEISATTSNSLAISESNTDTTYTKPATNSFTTTTSDVSFTTMVTNSDVTSDTQTTTVTAPPDNNTSTMPLNTINTAKTGLTKSIQSTSLHPSLTNSSAETHVPTKENQINGGVIFGAIVGAVLGTALIGLVGYFMCKKRKSEGFAHQRLYDDTRNDPVLRLDNAPESYGGSFEDTSYYNPTMANETAAQKGDVPPYDAIPMDDMTLSPHLP